MKLKRALKILVTLLVITVGGCVSGFGVLAWQQPDRVTLPAPTGPLPVGRIGFDWSDYERIDPLAPEPGISRELPVWIWYPAAAATEAPVAAYLPPYIADAIDAAAVPLVKATMGRLMTDQRNVHSFAREAPPMATGSFPVLIMRPMRGGFVLQYAAIAEDLASHGYVVVAADTPYTNRLVVYGDGRVVRRTAAGAPSEFAPGETNPLAPGLPNDLFIPVLDVLVADGRFLIDRLRTLNRDDPRFAHRLDLDSIGSFGHSVGGTTALQFCAVEPGCRAGIDIDGYLMGSVVATGLGKPFLFLFSDRPLFREADADVDEAGRKLVDALMQIESGLPNPVRRVVLESSAHYNFYDGALYTSKILGRASGSLGPIDPGRAIAATRAYVRAFFDVYLKGQPESQLSGLKRDYAEARIN